MATIKTLKLSAVMKSSVINNTLIRALVRWHGGWSEFKSVANDIAEHGANTGTSFIYYDDSTKFFRAHAPAIKEWLNSLAEDVYNTSAVELVKSWRVLDGYSMDDICQALYCGKGDAVDMVYCYTLWAMVEELATMVTDLAEQG